MSANSVLSPPWVGYPHLNNRPQEVVTAKIMSGYDVCKASRNTGLQLDPQLALPKLALMNILTISNCYISLQRLFTAVNSVAKKN